MGKEFRMIYVTYCPFLNNEKFFKLGFGPVTPGKNTVVKVR